MRVTVGPNGPTLSLNAADFVAEGGEGKVFARAGVAYKIYHDPALAPPEAKLKALAALAAPNVVGPGAILLNDVGARVGHTMRYVPDAHPLCRLFTGSFRQRHGLTDAHAVHLIERLRTTLAAVHAAGLLVVDLNEMNVLVGPRFDEVFLIDVESWQTPGYPATAILDTVRDRHASGFGEGTDWFAFAVLAFQLLVGVHPFKGKHPSVKGLDARMLAEISVLNPSVSMPPSARDPACIPPALRAWFEAVFHQRHRSAPPPFGPSVGRVGLTALPHSKALRVDVVWQADAPIRAAAEHLGTRCVVTSEGIWVNGRRTGDAPPGATEIGFDERTNSPFLGSAWDGALHLWGPDGAPIPVNLAARGVTAVDGRLYALGPDTLVAVRVVTLGGRPLMTPTVVARVRPFATTLFDGVALQRAPGLVLATVFPAAGQTRTLQLPEVADARVLDARCDGGVLALLVRRGTRIDRHEVRIDAAGRHDHRRVDGVVGAALELVTLDAGVAVLRTDGDTLDLFPRRREAPGRRQVQDAALGAEARLLRLGDGLGAVHGARLLRLTLR